LGEILIYFAVAGAALLGFTIAGVAGFGGGVIMLPILVWVLGVREAVPALTIAQLMGSVGRVWLYRREISWRVVMWFSLGALPTSALGGFLFIQAPKELLIRILGASMLLIVVYANSPWGKNAKVPLWGFTPLGGLFGFLAAFLGIPGPFMASFFLSYGLTAGAYLGTSSTSMMLTQFPKLAVFGGSHLFTREAVSMGVVVGIMAFVGAYTGKWILGRMPEALFPKLINALLISVGILFLITG